MRWLLLGVVFLLVSTMPGCGSEPPKAEAVYKRFFRSMVRYSKNPYRGFQQQAYALLTKSSHKALKVRTDKVNASLPSGVQPLEPFEMLVVRQSKLGGTILESTVVERSTSVTVLDVKYPRGSEQVVLRFEDGSWRVDLPL